MNANFGLVEELPDPPRDKRLKKERISARALAALAEWQSAHGIAPVGVGA
jgi:folate-dependent tRNA-U54 methylase TrmFO/GidA